MAFRRQNYKNAVYLYAATLPLLERAIDAKTRLSAALAEQLLYGRGRLPQALALGQSGKTADNESPTSFIDNLCNPGRCRALLSTGYKRLFYALALHYESENSLTHLRRYVRGHQFMVSR